MAQRLITLANNIHTITMNASEHNKIDTCEYELECLGDAGEPTYHTCIVIDKGFACPYPVRRCQFKMEQEEFSNYFVSVALENKKD